MVIHKHPYVWYMSCSKNSLSQRDRSSVLKGMAIDTLGGASLNLPARLCSGLAYDTSYGTMNILGAGKAFFSIRHNLRFGTGSSLVLLATLSKLMVPWHWLGMIGNPHTRLLMEETKAG